MKGEKGRGIGLSGVEIVDILRLTLVPVVAARESLHIQLPLVRHNAMLGAEDVK